MKDNNKLKEYQEMLENGVKGILSDENWQDYLKFQSTFYNYSFHNAVMILCQCPNATHVAGFKKWKTLERNVKKGEKAIKIFAPLIRKEEVDGEEEKVLYGYRMVNVFDASQTEGKDLPTLQRCKGLTGASEQAEFLLDMLMDRVIDIPMAFEELGDVKGYYSPKDKRIALNIANSPNHNAKTLMHECGHYWIRKKGIDIKSLFEDTEDYKGLYEVEEVIVESVAFIVGQYFGLDTSEYSFEYVAGWSSGDIGQIKKAGSLIQKLSFEMIEAIEVAAKEDKKEKKIPA